MTDLTPQMEPEAQIELKERTDKIRFLGKRAIDDIIEIGEHLTVCKGLVGHGFWTGWLEQEFSWSERQAERFMSVYRLAFKFDKLSDLDIPLSGLYLLAARSTPESARDEVLQRVEAGEQLKVDDIKAAIEEHKLPVAEGDGDDDVADDAHDDRGLHQEDHEADDHHDGPDADNERLKPIVTCSFCGKNDTQVKKIIQGSAGAICDQCVVLCTNVISDPIRETMLAEFFATANGSVVLENILAGRGDALLRELFDQLTVGGLLQTMSPEFGEELRDRVSAPAGNKNGKPDRPYTRTINLTATPNGFRH